MENEMKEMNIEGMDGFEVVGTESKSKNPVGKIFLTLGVLTGIGFGVKAIRARIKARKASNEEKDEKVVEKLKKKGYTVLPPLDDEDLNDVDTKSTIKD